MLALASCNNVQESASITGNWIEVMPYNTDIVQGVTINPDGTAQSIGMETLLYEKWSLENGRLILSGRSIGNGLTIGFNDTLDIIRHTEDSLIVGKHGIYQRAYYRTEDIQQKAEKVCITDSLYMRPEAGEIVSETYKGTLPAASCPGIEYTITIYHQQHSGDGVFHAQLKYLEAENGQDQCFDVYGRQYTLRGNASDSNSMVIQLVSFRGDDIMNFLKGENKLTMLDQELNRIESGLNYTLDRIVQ